MNRSPQKLLSPHPGHYVLLEEAVWSCGGDSEEGPAEWEESRVWKSMASGIPSSSKILLAYFRKFWNRVVNKTYELAPAPKCNVAFSESQRQKYLERVHGWAGSPLAFAGEIQTAWVSQRGLGLSSCPSHSAATKEWGGRRLPGPGGLGTTRWGSRDEGCRDEEMG